MMSFTVLQRRRAMLEGEIRMRVCWGMCKMWGIRMRSI